MSRTHLSSQKLCLLVLGFSIQSKRIIGQKCFHGPRGLRGAKSSSCAQKLRDFGLRWERGRGSCIKLTLSGMQENFSEIMKGTPSIAVRGKKRKALRTPLLSRKLSCQSRENRPVPGWRKVLPSSSEWELQSGAGCPPPPGTTSPGMQRGRGSSTGLVRKPSPNLTQESDLCPKWWEPLRA